MILIHTGAKSNRPHGALHASLEDSVRPRQHVTEETHALSHTHHTQSFLRTLRTSCTCLGLSDHLDELINADLAVAVDIKLGDDLLDALMV